MKKKFILIFLLFIIVGCTNNDEFQETELVSQEVNNKITKDEAVDIANKVLKKNTSTRISTKEHVLFDFVTSNNRSKTRCASQPDTLAYIINYPNDEGFVIVSTCRKFFPVLGFSDKGHFSVTNENVKSNFIDKIEEYTANASTDKNYSVDDINIDACYFVNPVVNTSISQGTPWDKYVIREHPNCPVGCVAVATALVLSHSMLELNYHGSVFHFKSIIEAIRKEQDSDNTNAIYVEEEWNKAPQPTYTYEQAVDSMAKLLYLIGKDLNITYTSSGSFAYSRDAYNLCKELKEDSSLEYSTFDIKKISWCIKDGYIIYLRGTDINGNGGHAWVSDGVGFCVEKKKNPDNRFTTEEITHTYIHCDWGWGGISNGYYSGSVFEASNYKFEPLNYFALKRGKNNSFSIAH